MNPNNNKFISFFTLLLILTSYTKAFSQLTEIEKELISPSLSTSRDLDYIIEASVKGVSSQENDYHFG